MADGGPDLGHRDSGIEHIGDRFVADIMDPRVLHAGNLAGPSPGRLDSTVGHSVGLCEDIRAHHLGEAPLCLDPVKQDEERVGDPDHVRDLFVFGGLFEGDRSLLKIHLAPFEIEDAAASLAGEIESVDDIAEVGGFFPDSSRLLDGLQLLVGDVALAVRLLEALDPDAGILVDQAPADGFPEGVANQRDLAVDRGSGDVRPPGVHIFVDILDRDRVDPFLAEELQRMTRVSMVRPGRSLGRADLLQVPGD